MESTAKTRNPYRSIAAEVASHLSPQHRKTTTKTTTTTTVSHQPRNVGDREGERAVSLEKATAMTSSDANAAPAAVAAAVEPLKDDPPPPSISPSSSPFEAQSQSQSQTQSQPQHETQLQMQIQPQPKPQLEPSLGVPFDSSTDFGDQLQLQLHGASENDNGLAHDGREMELHRAVEKDLQVPPMGDNDGGSGLFQRQGEEQSAVAEHFEYMRRLAPPLGASQSSEGITGFLTGPAADPIILAPTVPAGLDGMDFELDNIENSYHALDPSPNIAEIADNESDPGTEAYAKLEFVDRSVYITTTRFTIGRDREKWRRLRKQEKYRQKMVRLQQSRDANELDGDEFQKGGDIAAPRKRRKAGTSSRFDRTQTTATVDPSSIPGSHEDDSPFIGIWYISDIDGSEGKNSGISWRHMEVFFDDETNSWRAHIAGRNGVIINKESFEQGSYATLQHGDTVDIGPIGFHFQLPLNSNDNNHTRETSSVEGEDVVSYSENGLDMSLNFEPPREALGQNTTDESIDGEDASDDSDRAHLQHETFNPHKLFNESCEQEVEETYVEEDPVEQMATISPGTEQVLQPQKKRGPGRPPKNGIMSKREEKEAKKQARAQEMQAEQETGEASKSVGEASTIPEKKSVGRPRKHPKPEEPAEAKPKRPYKKRVSKVKIEGDVKEGSGSEQPDKQKKRKNSPEQPPAPAIQYTRDMFSAAELERPTSSYSLSIFKILSEAEGPMNLTAIYEAMRERWPFYRFTETSGWESSVRHNLNQHTNTLFKKVAKAGKGYAWGLVEGATLADVGKRKKDDPNHEQGNLQPSTANVQQMGHRNIAIPRQMGQPHGPPIGYDSTPNHIPFNPHQPPVPLGQYIFQGTPPQANGFQSVYPPTIAAPRPSSYSSPYAPKPTSAPAPHNVEQNHASGPRPPSTELQRPPPQQLISSPAQQPSQSAASAATNTPGPVTKGPVSATTAAPSTSTALASTTPEVQQEQPMILSPDEHTPEIIDAVNAFRDRLQGKMGPNGDVTLNAAIRRVLYPDSSTRSSENPEDYENMIVKNLTMILASRSGAKPKSSQEMSAPTQLNQGHNQTPSQPLPNQNRTQSNQIQHSINRSGTERPPGTLTRPSFTPQGYNRSNGTSLSRPPMSTPGLVRTNSRSPAYALPRETAPLSASPAPNPTPSTVNGGNTPTSAIGENTQREILQIADRKRERVDDDPDELPDKKRLSTTVTAPVKA